MAVVTALLLTTLAITIVASLFWQQQVQVRSIENQRLQLQKQWILRGALDWIRLILRTDDTRVDHLNEPWAVPLAETRLDEYVENGRSETEASDAVLSGGLADAQGRFNLTGLAENGVPVPAEVAAFGRLLSNARLNPALAQATADLMASSQPKPVQQAQQGQFGQPGSQQTSQQAQGMMNQGTGDQQAQQAQQAMSATQAGSDTSRPLPILHVDDLLAVPGFTPEALAAIQDFVIVLPGKTTVNVNTASAEVLAARIGTLSLAEATALVAGRQAVPFYSVEAFRNRLAGKEIQTGQLSVTTNYFLVNGNVRLNRATMRMQALIERKNQSPRVVWIREN
ncbi:type II secretion system minor pseudopilin GspK [Noviherbaspirillum galbum]|uniref:type II secretion system minor pseudopilin GspK n=1 Tax=Noviherbaspirillum galbum TaxID=2709383 RepID=UPI002E28807C|nr:type II secretion system minor pseudopilin GspK [Noviherbaspirillum galbum]